MFHKFVLALLSSFFVLTANAYYSISPGTSGDFYLGFSGVAHVYDLPVFQYGSSNYGQNDMLFDTAHTGMGGEIVMGYVIPTPKKSAWKNFRVEFSADYSSSSTDSSQVNFGVETPLVNGSITNWSTYNYEANSVVETDIDYLDLNLAFKSDIETNFLGMIFTPTLGVNVFKFDQNYNFNSKTTNGLPSNVTEVKLNEDLTSLFLGLKVGVDMTFDMADVFKVFLGIGQTFMQANAELDATQTITGTVVNSNAALKETDSDVSYRTFFKLGAILDTTIGTLTLLGRLDSFSHIPTITNPRSVTDNVRTMAYINTNSMTVTSAALNYTFAF